MTVAVTSGPRSRRICFRRRMWKKQAWRLCWRVVAMSTPSLTWHRGRAQRPPVWRRHCQLVVTSRWLRSSSDSHVNRTVLVWFTTDSAGDVWRHTSLQQQSHIAEECRWWMTRQRSLHSQSVEYRQYRDGILADNWWWGGLSLQCSWKTSKVPMWVVVIPFCLINMMTDPCGTRQSVVYGSDCCPFTWYVCVRLLRYD